MDRHSGQRGEWCHYKMKENAPSVLSVSTDANQTGKERLTRLIISSGSTEKEWKSTKGQPHPPPPHLSASGFRSASFFINR
ncbi:hypothetical protein SFC43_20780 [Bacteroides sp. CR5/BHMF/2]|nr:hypothetical protein [Bacteroides sp. CR5/BHMF/2]